MSTNSGSEDREERRGNNSLRIGFKLNDNNFVAWSYAMELMAKDECLWEVIKGTSKDPKKQATALKAISMNVTEDQIEDVLLGITSPVDAWKALATEYAGDTPQDVATIQIQLNTMKLASGPDEEETKVHLKRMKSLATKLATADDSRKLSDQALATQMLISLPDEFEPVKLKYLSGPSGELTPRNARNAAVAMIKRRAATNDCSAKATTAMTATSAHSRPGAHDRTRHGIGPGNRGNANIKGACWKCNKIGHRAVDCRSVDLNNNNQSDGGSAAIALTMTTLTNGKEGPRNGIRDFVVDNAATCGHTSSIKSHFKNLITIEESQRPTIGGIGPQRIQVHGRGDIEIRLSTGRQIILKDASYTPTASANIFAVRAALVQLEKGGSHGAEHREKSRSSKLLDGIGKTIMTSTVRNGLYYVDLHQSQDFQ
jgi:hypothetical protein